MNMKPVCKLIGTDGNAFSIIGRVSKTLKSVDVEKAKEFTKRAYDCESYDALLRLVGEYVEVV